MHKASSMNVCKICKLEIWKMTRINSNILECMCRVRSVRVVFVRNAISESGFRCAVMEVELSEASGWKLLPFLMFLIRCCAAFVQRAEEWTVGRRGGWFHGGCTWLRLCIWWCRCPLWVVSYTRRSSEQTLPPAADPSSLPPCSLHTTVKQAIRAISTAQL